MNCPVCACAMRKVVPLVFQGEGVETYRCMSEACDTVVNHKPVSMFCNHVIADLSVTCKGTQIQQAEAEALVRDILLTYNSVSPAQDIKIAVESVEIGS